MASTSGQPRVWSLWIYDRHCSLLFHADWSIYHNRNTLANTSNTTAASAASAAPSTTTTRTGDGGSSTLSLSEQSKLVYGVVFSLRNMTRKFSPLAENSNSSSSSNGAIPSSSSLLLTSKETFQSFSTSTYTLSHLQTPTNYTFIMLTDPIAPPTRRAPPPQSLSSSAAGGATSGSSLANLAFSASIAASSFSGGGGIPSTGGMSTSGVLSQIARGPWIEFVARNAACLALERQDDDDDDYDEYNNRSHSHAVSHVEDLKEADERREQKRKLKAKEVQKQRMTGLGKSIDSEAFKAAVERVLSQNKLSAPRM